MKKVTIFVASFLLFFILGVIYNITAIIFFKWAAAPFLAITVWMFISKMADVIKNKKQ